MNTIVVLDVLYEQLLEENDYTLETRWNHIVSFRESVLCSHYILDNIASRKRIIQSNSTVSKKRIVQIQRWSHIISFRESVLCSHYISILQSRNLINKKTKTRSRKTNSAEDIWSFRILIDLILWQSLVRSEKLDFALIASIHFFLIDFSIIFSFSHCIDIFYKLSIVKLHRDRFIDVARSIWKFWNSQWCYQIMMWLALSSISHYSNNWYLFHDVFFIQF